ncbi:MAG: ThiF family adenylyltransferase [Pseudomonadota bacterium]
MTIDRSGVHEATIKFPHTWLSSLRSELLNDLSREHFCILLGKREEYDGGFVINVIEPLIPGPRAYQSNSLGHVTPRKDFILYALSELQDRYDVDTLIDVHTHPFSEGPVHFSGIDDRDEVAFSKFFYENFDDLTYASIVFSQTEFSARVWSENNTHPTFAGISCPTPKEEIRDSEQSWISAQDVEEDFYNRTLLALGRDTVQKIADARNIVIVGLGGLGSVIAEDLAHMGFGKLTLIDHDTVERTNLNRIVGATWQDAEDNLLKVDAVKNHLLSIRPDLDVETISERIQDIEVDDRIALSDWIIIATDSHSSRFYCQELAFKYFIPFVSAGVSITVEDHAISDYSGEVIVVRPGDRICLNCLGRINLTKKAAEENQGNAIGDKLASRYVEGAIVKEPAVKTLNSVIGALAVEELLNQFSHRTSENAILVYERNEQTSIYPDSDSLAERNKNCFTCGIVPSW